MTQKETRRQRARRLRAIEDLMTNMVKEIADRYGDQSGARCAAGLWLPRNNAHHVAATSSAAAGIAFALAERGVMRDPHVGNVTIGVVAHGLERGHGARTDKEIAAQRTLIALGPYPEFDSEDRAMVHAVITATARHANDTYWLGDIDEPVHRIEHEDFVGIAQQTAIDSEHAVLASPSGPHQELLRFAEESAAASGVQLAAPKDLDRLQYDGDELIEFIEGVRQHFGSLENTTAAHFPTRARFRASLRANLQALPQLQERVERNLPRMAPGAVLMSALHDTDYYAGHGELPEPGRTGGPGAPSPT